MVFGAASAQAPKAFEGTVRYPDGRMAAGAKVSWVHGSLREAHLVATVKTDAEGHFRFARPPKERVLEQDNLLIEAPKAGLTLASPVDLMLWPEIVLARPTTLRVRAVGQDGRPVPHAHVVVEELHRESEVALLPSELRRRFSAVAGADGICHLPGLPQRGSLILAGEGEYVAPYREMERMPERFQGDCPPLVLLRRTFLEGRIVLAATGRPLAGIPVAARRDGLGLTFRGVTDSAGRYRLAGPPGAYSVYVPERNVAPLPGVATSSVKALGYSGEHSKVPDLRLVRGGILKGRITTVGSGKPQPNLLVRVTFGGYTANDPFQAVTDEDGRYALRIPPGKSQVSFQLGHPQDIQVRNGETVVRDLSIPAWTPPLTAPRRVTVTVVDADGKPVPYAQVRSEPRFALFGDSVFDADASGKVVLKDYLAQPPLTLRAEAGALASAAPVTLIDEREATLRVVPKARGAIEGIVRDASGKPLPNCDVSLFEQMSQMGSLKDYAVTDGQGRYRFEGLWPDRQYMVSAAKVGWSEAFAGQSSVRAGAVTRLEAIVLRSSSGAVAGKVVDDRGRPVAGADVALQNDSRISAVTDRQGRFRLSRVSEPKGRLSAQTDAKHLADGPYRVGEQNIVFRLQELAPPATIAVVGTSINAGAGGLVGQTAPELQANVTLDGKPLRLADLKGRIVVLDFWGIDCGPCVGALPGVKRIWSQFKDRDVVVIGLHHADSDPKDVRKFVQEKNLAYPVVIDASDNHASFGKTYRQYGVDAIPTVFVIGKDGKVVAAGIMIEDAFTKVGEMLAAQK